MLLSISMDDGVLSASTRELIDGAAASRALVTDEELLESLNSDVRVRIYNSDDALVRYYKGLSELPEEIELASGQYSVKVMAGDSSYASFDKPYYVGSSSFTISNGVETEVEVTCMIENTLLSVTFDETLEEEFDIETAELKGSTAYSEGIIFTPSVTESGYFLFPSQDEERDIILSFTAKTLTNEEITARDTIHNAESGTLYGVTIKYELVEKEHEGGFGLTIEIDDSLNEVESPIEIYQSPLIKGDGFDIDASLQFDPGEGERTVIWINTSSELTSLSISSDLFTSLLGISKSEYEFYTLSDSDKSELEEAGIAYSYSIGSSGMVTGKLVLTELFMSHFEDVGEYEIVIKAVDVNENETEKSLNLIFSGSPVTATALDIMSVYATRATLTGEIIDEANATGPFTFNYRESGGEWQSVEAVVGADGVTLTADVSGLTPGTTYEYVVLNNGEASLTVESFTTEEATPIPNGGFEDWCKASSGAYLPAASEEELWWDTGNHGSITLNKNVTQPDEGDYRPGSDGTTSAKLQSQFVGIFTIGKFAAGNIFAGSYGETSGTNATLNMGRPFTSRPSGFSFWYKYTCGVVDYESSAAGIAKGDDDIGKIYIVLGDWDSPVVINSADESTFFDINDEHIIAYAEYEQDYTTEEWAQITLDLEYRTTSRKPVYILIIASASKYGDYFAGSTSSILWLDDLELIYE